MKFRKLRVAFSTLCGVVFVLLSVLWVASYFSQVYLSKRFATAIVSLRANRGELGVWTIAPFVPGRDVTWETGSRSFEKGVVDHIDADDDPQFELFGFRYETMPPVASVFVIPFWALVLPIAAAGVLPWMYWRIGWRAAASGACLIVAILLCSLWARSYKWFDITDRTAAVNLCSMNGKLLVGDTFILTGGDSLNPAAPVPPSRLGICSLRPEKFQLLALGDGVAVPYWLMVFAAVLLSAVPWLQLRFRLRTILLGMAVISVLLFALLSALKR